MRCPAKPAPSCKLYNCMLYGLIRNRATNTSSRTVSGIGHSIVLTSLPSFSGGAGKHDREGGSAESVRHGETNDFGTIKQELYESAERAIQDNLDTFERKYKMQQRELAAELSRVMEHTGDRIIKAVTSGPHDRIKDPVSRFSDLCRNRADYARSIFMRYGRTW